MSYFRARRYKNLFEDFKKLTYQYWNTLPPQPQSFSLGEFRYKDSNESFAVRQKIAEALPHVEEAANFLGVHYVLQSVPPPAAGGPILPVSVFRSVIHPEMGYGVLDRAFIIDTITMCRSVAYQKCHDELIHLLLPWNWVIDSCAFIIRIPFIILRRAGLPAKVEENIISQGIKVLAIVILLSLLAYKGVSLTGINIVDLIKNIFR